MIVFQDQSLWRTLRSKMDLNPESLRFFSLFFFLLSLINVFCVMFLPLVLAFLYMFILKSNVESKHRGGIFCVSK